MCGGGGGGCAKYVKADNDKHYIWLSDKDVPVTSSKSHHAGGWGGGGGVQTDTGLCSYRLHQG